MNFPRLLETAFPERGDYNIKSNGYGFLTDCLSCNVVEKEKGEYTLSMKYPANGIIAEEIQLGRVIVARPNSFDEEQPFVIVSIKRASNGNVNVVANHISYQLGGVMVENFNAITSQNFAENINSKAVNSNFVFQTDISKTAFYGGYLRPPRTFRAMLLDKENSFRSIYGGYIKFNGLNVFAYNKAGEDTGAEIVFGKNLLSLSQTCGLGRAFSAVYPFWYSENVYPVEDRYVELPEKTISTLLLMPKDFDTTLPLDLSIFFETKPTVEELRNAANDWLYSAHMRLKDEEIKLSFADLNKTTEYSGKVPVEKLRIYDTISVRYPMFGISQKTKITGTDYDVLYDKYKNIYLGDFIPDFSDTILNRR